MTVNGLLTRYKGSFQDINTEFGLHPTELLIAIDLNSNLLILYFTI